MFILWLKDVMSAINQPCWTEQRCCFFSAVITHSDVSRDGQQCHLQAALVNQSCCGSRKGGKKRKGKKKKPSSKPFHEWARRQCLDPWDVVGELRWTKGPRCFSGESTKESNTPGSADSPRVRKTNTHAGRTRCDGRMPGSQASCTYNEVPRGDKGWQRLSVYYLEVLKKLQHQKVTI